MFFVASIFVRDANNIGCAQDDITNFRIRLRSGQVSD